MANEIVKLVAKKANISEPVAQIAVDTVLNLLKSKLPPAAGSMLNAFLGSGSVTKTSTKTSASKTTKAASTSKKKDGSIDIGAIAGALGGLLGKK
jgi:uncharacterized protein (DUF2267 family)